jgi:segregation and condensation protein B
MEKQEFKKIVEAILFSSPEPLTINKIARFSGGKIEDVRLAIEELLKEYSERDSSIEIVKIGERYLMRVKHKYSSYVEGFLEKDLDRGSLRTLAVIALRQPITLSKLAKIRGNKCYEHVKKLKEMGLVRAEKEGRSTILTTTKEFATYFGLKSSDPAEIKEMLKKYSEKDARLEKYLSE